MIEKAFKASTLVMSSRPLEEIVETSSWIDIPLCKYLSIAALIIYTLTFIPLLQLLPIILECNFRGKVSISLEHNLSLARIRNIIFFAYLFIFILICDRFNLMPSTLVQSTGTLLSFAVCAGTICAYLLLRLILYSLILSRKSSFSFNNAETCIAARRMNYNTFILFFTFTLATIGITTLTGCNDNAIRTILWVESGLFYLLTLIRTGEILNSFAGLFQTILYLCGLELLPTAALIASTLL